VRQLTTKDYPEGGCTARSPRHDGAIAVGQCLVSSQANPELFPGGHISTCSEADATLRSFNELLNERSRRMRRRMKAEFERSEGCSEEAKDLNEHLAPVATTKEI